MARPGSPADHDELIVLGNPLLLGISVILHCHCEGVWPEFVQTSQQKFMVELAFPCWSLCISDMKLPVHNTGKSGQDIIKWLGWLVLHMFN